MVTAGSDPAIGAALQGQTLRYVGYAERSPGPFQRRETPGSRVVLILSLGPRLRVGPAAPAARPATHRSFVAGLHEHPVVTEHDGEQLGIQIDLAPLAARRLLGLPLAEIANAVVEIEDILGAAAGEVIERLHGEAAWADRFAVLDRFLGERLRDAGEIAPAVERAVSLIETSGGRATVGAVAAEVGWSRPHLTARFQEEIGLPPKTFARIVRFEHARSLILAGGGADLVRVAVVCGYSDQPHMNRDFREFAGASPRDYLARRLPDGGGVSSDLPSVQDVAAAAA